MSRLLLTNVNVDVQLAQNGKYSYNYNSSKFTVTTDLKRSTFKIKVVAKKTASKSGAANEKVMVYIPNKAYNRITGISKKSGLSLPAVNANITVSNKSGAVAIRLPHNYSRTVNYTGVSGSGALIMNRNKNFAVNAKFSACAVVVPGSWPTYSNDSSNYSYIRGSGTAKINIDLKNCSFSFNK